MSRWVTCSKKAQPNKPSLVLDTLSSSSTALPFSKCATLHTPHVHFPPTPTMVTSTHIVPGCTYDRAPIRVSLNSCALPERNCRIFGECGNDEEGSKQMVSSWKQDYFHPQANQTFEPIPRTTSPVSISDSLQELCFESDESDDLIFSRQPELSPSTVISSIAVYSSQSAFSPSKDTSDSKTAAQLTFVPPTPAAPANVMAGRRRSTGKSSLNRSCSPAGRTVIRSRRSIILNSICAEDLDGCLGGF